MRTIKTLFPIGFGLIVTFGLVFRIAQASQAAQPNLPTATTLYVDADANGAATGIDWTNAYTTVQDALAVAVSGDEIWVAEGVYFPDDGIGQVNDIVSSTFALTNGVALYGGFDPGSGIDAFDERDWVTYPTVLSGDIDHETQPDIVDSNGVVTEFFYIQGDNTYHVVTGNGTNATAVLDGFTITAGEANQPNNYSHGGGMQNRGGSPTLSNITFSGNFAKSAGGGIYNAGIGHNGKPGSIPSNPSLTNVTFSGNSADEGGGMYNVNSNPVLMNVTFSNNSAGFNSDFDAYDNKDIRNMLPGEAVSFVNSMYGCLHNSGGGMHNQNSNPTLINVTFNDNFADLDGSGMCNVASNPVLTNVIFSYNIANNGEGGGMYNDCSDPRLTNVTFSDNSSDEAGGGMYNYLSSPVLTEVIFSGNSADWAGGGMYNDGSSPILTNTVFTGNLAENGGGMYTTYFSDFRMPDDITFSTPVLTNVIFSGNSADNGGGMFNRNSSPLLTNVTFSGNSATSGGGIYNDGSNVTEGPVVPSNPTLTNVTFSGNQAFIGGGMFNYLSSPTLINNILWSNMAFTDSQIHNVDADSTPSILFSNIDGSGSSAHWNIAIGIDGGGNIDEDPFFERNPDPGPDGHWEDDDYGDLRPQPGSPVINSGTNDGCPVNDLDGGPRPINGICDMGAYETGYALIITKAVDDASPKPGQTITFTVVITNRDLDVTGGVIWDNLPTELNFLGPITLEPAKNGLVGFTPPTLAHNLTISYTERVTVTFPVTVSHSLTVGTQLINTVSISTTELITPLLSSVAIIISDDVKVYLPLIRQHQSSLQSDNTVP